MYNVSLKKFQIFLSASQPGNFLFFSTKVLETMNVARERYYNIAFSYRKMPQIWSNNHYTLHTLLNIRNYVPKIT